MQSFTFISYNIRKSKGIRGSTPRIEEIGEAIAERDPAVLLCQEVFCGRLGEDQTKVLSSSLGMTARYEANAVYARGHHGNATFSKFRVLKHENFDISTNRIERRGVLHTLIDLGGETPLHLFNTHFGLNRGQRRRQATRVINLIHRLAEPTHAVILAGDFNDWQAKVDQMILETTGLRNGMHELSPKDRRTWSTRRPILSLDRVYYRGVDLESIQVLRDPSWIGLSDHFPVECSFRQLR